VRLGLGVMVVFVVAVGLRYGCDSVALSTRVFIFENERIVEEIAVIFGTGVNGCEWDGGRVFRRKGGSPSTTATVMVGVLQVLIPLVVHIGTCTTEGVLLEY